MPHQNRQREEPLRFAQGYTGFDMLRWSRWRYLFRATWRWPILFAQYRRHGHKKMPHDIFLTRRRKSIISLLSNKFQEIYAHFKMRTLFWNFAWWCYIWWSNWYWRVVEFDIIAFIFFKGMLSPLISLTLKYRQCHFMTIAKPAMKIDGRFVCRTLDILLPSKAQCSFGNIFMRSDYYFIFLFDKSTPDKFLPAWPKPFIFWHFITAMQ